jgi:hypothetical protein
VSEGNSKTIADLGSALGAVRTTRDVDGIIADLLRLRVNIAGGQGAFHQLADAINEVVMTMMTPEQRLELVAGFSFCRHCGRDDPEHACQCWNDE